MSVFVANEEPLWAVDGRVVTVTAVFIAFKAVFAVAARL